MASPDTAPIAAFLEAHHVTLAKEVARFAAEQIAPLPVPEQDAAARAQARTLAVRLGAAGWLRHALPPLDGSAGAPDLRACALIREALSACSTLADAVFALQALGSMPLVIAGSSELRARWLPKVAQGTAMAAFAMTEPEAGSDVASLRTSARRDGADYVLCGEKTLISNAGIADFYCVFAATDSAAGHRGLSCFVVAADTPGLRFVEPQHLSAPHPIGRLAFDDCRVPASSRLGAEGDGFAIGMEALDRLRATVAAAACGMAARALEEALGHARRRHQFGKPLAEFQLTQQRLAQMATELCAARLLTYRAVWEKDRGAARVTLASAMAKAYATEAAQRIVDGAVQICGGAGVLVPHPVERLYRSVRALRIYEGTTEIQHLVIAKQLLKEAKE